MNNYKGMMDGWHGDEPEIGALAKTAWQWQDEPEDEWDDRRRREMVQPKVTVSDFKELNAAVENIRNSYKIAYGDKK